MATKMIARPNHEYILRGINANGDEFFYTGKAGSGWVSKDRKEAFGYWTEQMARGKARWGDVTAYPAGVLCCHARQRRGLPLQGRHCLFRCVRTRASSTAIQA
jgi:hypothetical protein